MHNFHTLYHLKDYIQTHARAHVRCMATEDAVVQWGRSGGRSLSGIMDKDEKLRTEESWDSQSTNFITIGLLLANR